MLWESVQCNDPLEASEARIYQNYCSRTHRTIWKFELLLVCCFEQQNSIFPYHHFEFTFKEYCDVSLKRRLWINTAQDGHLKASETHDMSF